MSARPAWPAVAALALAACGRTWRAPAPDPPEDAAQGMTRVLRAAAVDREIHFDESLHPGHLAARRRALLAAVEEEGRRLARLEAECTAIEGERAQLSGLGFEETERAARAHAVAELGEALATAEGEALAAEERHAAAREAEGRGRGPLTEAERAAQRLETEARTLMGLLGSDLSGPWPRAVDAVSVARGYEAARR